MNFEKGYLCKIEVIKHHLRLFGINENVIAPTGSSLIFIDQINEEVENVLACHGLAIALNPSAEFLTKLKVKWRLNNVSNYLDLIPAHQLYSKSQKNLRTFNSCLTFENPLLEPVVVSGDGEMVWSWLPRLNGGILLLGSDLAGDLIRFRQGDPRRAAFRPTSALWGVAGERPNYLFNSQLEGLPYNSRPADDWCEHFASFVARKLGLLRAPILPGGAPGAIVITGDDDQAYLEKYAEQIKALSGLPITYFLHPLTHHNANTLQAMQKENSGVSFGIHPDALDAPNNYANLLKSQCNWFQKLTGFKAKSLRNHGYLNDGYWGHLNSWIKEGIGFSTNIPGIDGRALNGSLLPARIFYDEKLTQHWSILTAIGDGIRYLDGGRSDKESANCIFNLADSIRSSAIPGVMVINLHPQNIGDTREMHKAINEVIKTGFIPWNMEDCINWFSK
jgi:hypothetical protein